VKILAPFVTLRPTFTPLRVANSGVTRTFCIDKAKKHLGYKPIVSLNEGKKRTLDYFKHLEDSKK